MGEAKRRGTYEQRKAAAIEFNTLLEKERRDAREIREKLMPPEQKAARLKRMQWLALAAVLMSEAKPE